MPADRIFSALGPGAWRLIRFEIVLLGICFAVWLLAVLALFGVLPLAGAVAIDLYRFYSLTAVLGWIAGNVYVVRQRSLPGPKWRRRLLLSYLVGPAGMLYLLRALAPLQAQQAAPLVPLMGFGVYTLFFFVPVTLRGSRPCRD